MLEFINTLFEAASGPRIPHPEDAIFDGAPAANQYIESLKYVIANPGGISIKWDGGIALIFGTDPEGRFFINDKYMPEGFYAHSPADWQRYDTTIKKSQTSRGDLYSKLAVIWKGLEASVTKAGVYKGDLMAVSDSGQALPLTDGAYQFQGPTVTYRIPPNSPLGKVIENKVGVVVVHQANGSPWDGRTGLANQGNVAIIAPTAGIKFTLAEPTQLVKAVNKVKTVIPKAEQFLLGTEKTNRDLIKTYFNKKITAQTNDDIYTWVAKNARPPQVKKLLGDNQGGYLYRNQAGYEALRTVWNSVYQLKVNLVEQLEKQVKGFDQYVAGQKSGEGFVFNTPTGLVKLVNRGVFGAAHFNK